MSQPSKVDRPASSNLQNVGSGASVAGQGALWVTLLQYFGLPPELSLPIATALGALAAAGGKLARDKAHGRKGTVWAFLGSLT